MGLFKSEGFYAFIVDPARARAKESKVFVDSRRSLFCMHTRVSEIDILAPQGRLPSRPPRWDRRCFQRTALSLRHRYRRVEQKSRREGQEVSPLMDTFKDAPESLAGADAITFRGAR